MNPKKYIYEIMIMCSGEPHEYHIVDYDFKGAVEKARQLQESLAKSTEQECDIIKVEMLYEVDE